MQMKLNQLMSLIERISDTDEEFMELPLYVSTTPDKFYPILNIGVYDGGADIGKVVILTSLPIAKIDEVTKPPE